MMRNALVVATIAASAYACGEPPVTPPPGAERPDSEQVWFHYSPAEAVAHFGRYHLEPSVPPPPTYPTATPDGEFVTGATSSAGHRVGKVAGRFAIWPANQAAPSYMFPADTNESQLAARLINDRLEVALVGPPGFSSVAYIWRGARMQSVYKGCANVVALNNRGLVGLNTTCQLYNSGFTVASPFDPDTAWSGRFAGQKCGVGGRYSSIRAINDDNEVLKQVERSPGQGPATILLGSGCVDLDRTFPGVGLTWSVLGPVLAGGFRSTGTGFDVGVITDGAQVAAVNDLLDDSSRSEWRVLAITRVNADHTLNASAVSMVDGRVIPVRLLPAG